MNPLAGASYLRWGLASVYLGLCLLPLLVLPTWICVILVVIWLVITLRSFLGAEAVWGRSEAIRPLTRWDLPDWERFQVDLAEAVERMGWKHQPLLAVLPDDEPNAMAITTPRGLIILTRGLLQRFTQEEITALVGHELAYLVSRDALPAILGGSFLHVLGLVDYHTRLASAVPVHWTVVLVLRLISFATYLFLITVGKVAEITLAQRRRASVHHADLIAAHLTSAETMISALERLAQTAPKTSEVPRWSVTWIDQRLRASHPPLAARVIFLQSQAKRGELFG